jgi:hypothetical protein
MAIISTRLNSSGTLYVNGILDEISTSTLRTTTDTVYAAAFDEVTYAGDLSFAQRLGSDGTHYVTDEFDEFTGAPLVDNSLVLWLDAGQPASYPGVGNTWTSLTSAATTSSLFTTTYLTSIGGSLNFNGITSYADVVIPNLTSASTCTVEMLVNIKATGSRMPFGFTSYDVYLIGGNIGFNTGASDLYGIPSSTVTNLGIVNKWTHYTFVMRNNVIFPTVPYTNNKIYINGVAQSLTQILNTQSSILRSFSNGICRISGWVNSSTQYKASMDLAVFKVYNRELTEDEVQQNFNATRRRYNI